ncbi:Protein phosphatase 2C [Candidatus Bilamarchaeum dharawalense]|uniref:Protein phosphatase 2C n=1 Tax=Candidatus Bilamarchaeum dharawalense TaxID=2885759 RepID=A0A5E4LPZ3_9ARCH|nr:Protein phosphatase 2C [Candidatus Bilamarchaeum dharawalense]
MAETDPRRSQGHHVLQPHLAMVVRSLAYKWGVHVYEPIPINRSEQIFTQLTSTEKDFIIMVLGKKGTPFDQQTLEQFLQLHAGVRDLRMQIVVTEGWALPTWKQEIQTRNATVESLIEKCNFTPATQQEQLEAVAIAPSYLQAQFLNSLMFTPMRSVLPTQARFQSIVPPEMALKLELFTAWVGNDNQTLSKLWNALYPSRASLDSLRTVLTAERKKLTEQDVEILRWLERVENVSILTPGKKGFVLDRSVATTAYNHIGEKLHAHYDLWFKTPMEERCQYWHHGSLDLFTAASLAHKVRFDPDPKFSREEVGLVDSFVSLPQHKGRYKRSAENLPTSLDESFSDRDLSPEIQNALRRAFVSPTSNRRYQPNILDIAAFDSAMDLGSLRRAAFKEAQFNLLRSFLWVEHSAHGEVSYNDTVMKAKRDENGNPKVCEDNFSSATIITPGGHVIQLDAVFDGMGGHFGGERASEIAKEVFELAAIAGWLKTPEDVRRIIVMIDLAIVMEQINSKTNDSSYQENNMGTTVTVTFQKGKEFYGIHCGDSDWRIIRDGETLEESTGHSRSLSFAYEFVLADLRRKGLELHNLTPEQTREFYKLVLEKTKEFPFPANHIGSAAGAGAGLIFINNRVYQHEPIILENGDIVVANSDGVGVPVCPHEFARVIELYHGDLAEARAALINMAESRRADNQDGPVLEGPDGKPILDAEGKPTPTAVTSFETICQCTELRPGKTDDDKTVMLRRVSFSN